MSPPDDDRHGPPPDAGRAGPPAEPVLLRIDGDATPDEVAALLAAITAITARPSTSPPSPPSPAPLSRWRDRRAALRRVPPAHPDAWRASAWPSSPS